MRHYKNCRMSCLGNWRTMPSDTNLYSFPGRVDSSRKIAASPWTENDRHAAANLSATEKWKISNCEVFHEIAPIAKAPSEVCDGRIMSLTGAASDLNSGGYLTSLSLSRRGKDFRDSGG
jgi:hypothetical protein